MNKIFLIAMSLFVISLPVRAQTEPKSNIYSPAGKRDPFRPPAALPSREVSVSVNPTERYSLEQFQLRAIIKGIGKNRAMFEDPDAKAYILFEGDSLGRERATLSRILDRGVIVTERTFNYLGEESLFEKVISLPSDSSQNVAGVEIAAKPPPVLSVGNRDTANTDSTIPNPLRGIQQTLEKSVEKQVEAFVSPTSPSRVQPIQITPMNPLVPQVPNATPLTETKP
jgi:Tfp pilus assembly protein PilP